VIFGLGAAMGWTASDVKAASFWEFLSAWDGFLEANTPKDKSKLTEEEADELFAWIEGANDRPQILSTQTYRLDGDQLVPAGVVTFQLQ
jgi:hypothetical protein